MNTYTYWFIMCIVAGKMSVPTALHVSVICDLLVIVIADLERVQHAGHVHTAHEVDGQHNVEFDHEAILGEFCMQCILVI